MPTLTAVPPSSAAPPSPYHPDILGDGFEARTIPLRDDAEGPVVATLVRKQCPTPTRRAVLYVHGYVDYFFQVPLAEQYLAHGFTFYALDLRKYGRSLLPHQSPNLCTDISDYFEELDAAIDIIRREDAHTTVLLNGHSTGGLLSALYTHHRRDRHTIDGLFLNSPFFDLNTSLVEKRLVAPVVSQLGRLAPRQALPLGITPWYGQSIHKNYHGEWDYNLTWKPTTGFPLYAGWLHAIICAHRQVHAGLSIPCPTLVMCSAHSVLPKRWDDALSRVDSVLDVRDIRRYSATLGDHVTIVSVDGGLHDLTLSAPPVRARVYDELFVWTSAYFQETR